MFRLHPRLAADSVAVGELALCHVLLANDANYPWLILVPRRVGVTEIYQLDEGDRAALMEESFRGFVGWVSPRSTHPRMYLLHLFAFRSFMVERHPGRPALPRRMDESETVEGAYSR